jgi:hypothetical protein
VYGLDYFDSPLEQFMQTLQQSEVDAPVKLYGGQAGLLRLLRDLLCGQGGEDAYSLDMCGKMRRDVRYLLRRYLALAGREDEADRVGTEVGGELRVGEICVGADLDPHGWYSASLILKQTDGSNDQTITAAMRRTNKSKNKCGDSSLRSE